jgi:hypothetical protein
MKKTRQQTIRTNQVPTREVKGLHNDASKDGSDDQEHRHRWQQLKPVQGFHLEVTKPKVVFACPL